MGHGLPQGGGGEPSFMLDSPQPRPWADLVEHGAHARRKGGANHSLDGLGHSNPELNEASIVWTQIQLPGIHQGSRGDVMAGHQEAEFQGPLATLISSDARYKDSVASTAEYILDTKASALASVGRTLTRGEAKHGRTPS